MNHFPENLARLRKEAGYTQESLAEALGVSRQAVSKWESGQAMPEAATLVELAELLGCSLDQLMRQELGEDLPVPESQSAEPAQDRAVFAAWGRHMDRFSTMMASGVALVLTGVAALLLTSTRVAEGDPLVVLPLFLFLAVAVALFVWGGISHGDFLKAHPDVPMLWTDEEHDAFRRKFRLGITLAVVGVLLNVTLLVLLGWRAGENEAAQARAVALFMVLLAACVWVFVYLGIQMAKMEGEPGKKCAGQPDDPWAAVIMMSATILYLLLGFVWDLWHPGWVVFPVGGILCGILNVVRKK